MSITKKSDLANCNDYFCCVCDEKSSVSIFGHDNCHTCGNQINLCKKHRDDLLVELIGLDNFSMLDFDGVLGGDNNE